LKGVAIQKKRGGPWIFRFFIREQPAPNWRQLLACLLACVAAAASLVL
jgi:hypothetical protein